MIWALLGVLLIGFLSGGSSAFLVLDSLERADKSIKANVEDKAHRKELRDLIDEAEGVTKKYLKNGKKTTKELAKLLGRHDAKARDIQTVLKGLREDIEIYQDRMIRYRFALKTKMSREEWAMVFPANAPARTP